MARWLLKRGARIFLRPPNQTRVTPMRISRTRSWRCRRCGRVARASPRRGVRRHLLRQRTDRDAGRPDRRKYPVRDGRAERRSPRPDPVHGRRRTLRLGRPDAGGSDGQRRLAAALHVLLGGTVPTYGFSSTSTVQRPGGGSMPAGTAARGRRWSSGGGFADAAGGPTVVFKKTVGAFDVTVLQGGTAEEVSSWLRPMATRHYHRAGDPG